MRNLLLSIFLLSAAVLIFIPVGHSQSQGTGAGTAASIYRSTFANLGTPTNGSVRYCTDCNTNVTPCTSGGTGAFAYRVNGAWSCASAATSSSVTANATVGVIPYLSAANVFSDSPLTRTSSTIVTVANTVNYNSLGSITGNGSSNSLDFVPSTGAIVFSMANWGGGVLAQRFGNTNLLQWDASQANSNTPDTTVYRTGAGGIGIGTTTSNAAGTITVGGYRTGTNCSDSAGAAACGSAAAGSVVIDAAATTVVVSTTAVTANSQIFVQYDSSLGTRLGVTCNTTPALPAVTARTAATSFTITVPAAPAVNPACYNFFLVN